MPENNNYIIWTLNATQNLINEEILNNYFWKGRFKTGDRSGHNPGYDAKKDEKTKKDEPHNLMPGPEYFVPVAAKCIGQRFSDNYLAESNNEIKTEVKKIRKYFYNIWKKDPKRARYNEGNIYKSFWKEGAGPDASSGMKTKNNMGYYDILKESFDKTGKKNILVAYSQGGLVARYLAWLDEYIFKENLIEGIITVQSANYGSPLANNNNSQVIIDLIMTSLLSIISLYQRYFPKLNKYVRDGIDFENLKTILEDIRSDALKELENNNENAQWIYDFIITSQKWTSGLDIKVCDTAFCDLDLKKLDEKYSILESVNKNILNRIKYGAIIGSLNDFTEILQSIISEMKKGKCIMNLIFKNMLKKKFLMGNTFQDNFNTITELYKEIMTEQIIDNGFTDIYKNGLIKNNEFFTVDKNIPEYSHDFVIPTSYQLIENNKKDNFLGIFLNNQANHNSGKSRESNAGKINSKYIIKLLKKLLKQNK